MTARHPLEDFLYQYKMKNEIEQELLAKEAAFLVRFFEEGVTDFFKGDTRVDNLVREIVSKLFDDPEDFIRSLRRMNSASWIFDQASSFQTQYSTNDSRIKARLAVLKKIARKAGK